MSDLTVVSWNVLADCWAKPHFFPLSPKVRLVSGARVTQVSQAVADLADTLAVDMFGLQEVDRVTASAIRRALGGGWAVDVHIPRQEGAGTLLAVRSHLDVRSLMTIPVQRHGRAVHTGVIELPGEAGSDNEVRFAVAHVPWGRSELQPDAHPGVAMARRIVALAGDGRPLVLAADLNDLPGGPVRQVLADGGLAGLEDPTPTSLFDGDEPRALDVVAARGAALVRSEVLGVAEGALPDAERPSDHLPVLGVLRV